MIMKEPSNFKIHRLQFLYAYESDHNVMLTLHWRHTLYSIEDQKLLNDGAYGNRPNILAVTSVFMEELMLQIMKLTFIYPTKVMKLPINLGQLLSPDNPTDNLHSLWSIVGLEMFQGLDFIFKFLLLRDYTFFDNL